MGTGSEGLMRAGAVGQGKKRMGEKILPDRGENLCPRVFSRGPYPPCPSAYCPLTKPSNSACLQSQTPQPPAPRRASPLPGMRFSPRPSPLAQEGGETPERSGTLSPWKALPEKAVVRDFQRGRCQMQRR